MWRNKLIYTLLITHISIHSLLVPFPLPPFLPFRSLSAAPFLLLYPSSFAASRSDCSHRRPMGTQHPSAVIRPTLEKGNGLCVISASESRWIARSALPLGTSKLLYNGNQRSLCSGAVISELTPRKKHHHTLFLFAILLLRCGLVHLHVGPIHPLWSWLIISLYFRFELLCGHSLLHVR